MRVRTGGEVQTPDNIVKKMIDYIEPIELDKTYLEPCCWQAPFLKEILKRKLKLCHSYEDVLTAYKTVYGYELYEDNLEEGRRALKSLFADDINISIIVNTNLVLMDGLTGLDPRTGRPTEVYDWREHKWTTLFE